MSFLGLGKKEVKFVYMFHVHALSPFPSNIGAPLAIVWKRGDKRAGVTRTVLPTPGEDGTCMVAIDERFEVEATLYKTAQAKDGPFGPFESKTISLALHEMEVEADGNMVVASEIALGRLLLDLTDFVGLDQTDTRAFPMNCHAAIHDAVGQPVLAVTIRCQWLRPVQPGEKKVQLSNAAARVARESAGKPIQVDTNLMKFFQYKYKDASGVSDPNPMAIGSTAAVATLAKSALQANGPTALSQQPPKIIQSELLPDVHDMVKDSAGPTEEERKAAAAAAAVQAPWEKDPETPTRVGSVSADPVI